MNQHAANWDHCLEYAELSDVGLRRANNQDSLALAVASSQEQWQQKGHLFMVADGMGAHAAGELASRLATSIVPLTYHKLNDRPPPAALAEAIRDANNQIHNRGQASEDFRGMGTTFSSLVILPQGAVVAQVGDSRVYRLRGHRLEQLSFDHSLVWEMRAAGRLPPDDVPTYIPKNIITRCLGPNAEVQVDLEGPFPIEPGDTFLLCSDGLSGQVKDEEIGKVLACLPPSDAVRSLVDLANLNGGPDNITVIVIRVTGAQVAQGKAAGPSSRSGSEGHSIHPAAWGLLAVFLLAGLGLLAIGQTLLALLSFAGAAVTAVAIWAQRSPSSDTSSTVFDGQTLGRGPYATFGCAPDDRFIARLCDLVQQLRDAATNEKWNVDWDGFNSHNTQAAAAAQAGDPGQAVREYCHAISFMMEQLRNQRGRARPGNTTVDLF